MRGNIIISFPLTVIQVGLSHSQHLQKSPGKDFQVQIWTMPVTVPWLEPISVLVLLVDYEFPLDR